MYIPDAEIELDMSTQPRCLSQVLRVICSCVVGQRNFLSFYKITDNGPLVKSVSVSAEVALD